MLLRAVHRTTYRYPFASRESHNEVRLKPLDGSYQRCLAFDLKVDPPTKLFSYEEVGGTVHHFVVRTPHTVLTIEARTTVETRLDNPFEGLNLLEDDWREEAVLAERYPEFLASTPRVPVLDAAREIADAVPRTGSVAGYAIHLGERIHDLLAYDPDATHVNTPLSFVIEHRAGVCQDFAHLALACLRAKNIPARYVSGYLYSGVQGLRGDEATHAWVECALPGGRWLGIDPTNRCLTNDHHIRVHTGRDYDEVPPTRGIYTGPAAERLEIAVRVERVAEAPSSFRSGDEAPTTGDVASRAE